MHLLLKYPWNIKKKKKHNILSQRTCKFYKLKILQATFSNTTKLENIFKKHTKDPFILKILLLKHLDQRRNKN